MKKYLLIIIISTIVISVFSYNMFAADEETAYSTKLGFDLYQDRIKAICDEYIPEKKITNIEDTYEEIPEETSFSLNDIKEIYKKNMNDIYKCSLISMQRRAILLIKEDLITKNPDLMDTIWKKIDNELKKLDSINSSLECLNLDDDESSSIKVYLLKQTTYETCKYLTYLEYLKEINNKIFLDEWQDKKSISSILEEKYGKGNTIEDEIENVYKVFPLAFHAAQEYENNIWIHFLLSLIKEDYLILREKLHEVLNPINQVVYKVSNAMRE